jgi:hypothetical protein
MKRHVGVFDFVQTVSSEGKTNCKHDDFVTPATAHHFTFRHLLSQDKSGPDLLQPSLLRMQ